ncbi:CBM96 family carbohydrate-binding protein [Paenibacillus silviterrae]|uniref:CBM96 family carbohydrate-binding protein n=1 Tax=Paenibacillus silviterrae TaxID=3242194 RepID=UPI002543F089|nr:DNRLRE domain-containing protein [Paenibacillus chinjuensis]
MNRFLVWMGVLLVIMFPGSAHAQTSWWGDSRDAAADARSVWVYYSNEYDWNYNSDTKVINVVKDMNSKNIDIIIASMTYADIANLSNPAAERTKRLQLMINEAASRGMKVYAGHWEEQFTGSSDQMSKYTRVDHIISFNSGNAATDADIVGVVTDYEMHGSNRSMANYDNWRLFHHNLKSRIGMNSLKVLPVTNDPDVWISGCTDCTSSWKSANGITGSNPFTGDVAYFSSYNGTVFADSLIGMYYYAAPSTIQAKAHDDIVEAQNLATSIVVGFSVGPNGVDPSLVTEGEVIQAVRLIESERAAYPLGVLGTMCWRWDKPDDTDQEYRDIMGAQFPAIEDAHVRGGTSSGDNYGASALLEVKDAPGGTDYDRLSYWKFDLSEYTGSSVQSAVLSFYLNTGVNDASVPSVPVTWQGLTVDSWQESTVTWNNRPGTSGASVLGTVSLTNAGWYSIDITSYVNSQMADKVLTLRLSDDTSKDRLVKINSKENTNGAYLTIH